MQRNMSQTDRMISAAAGSWLLLRLLRSRSSPRGFIRTGLQSGTGLGLLWRGISGSCPLYSKYNIDTTSEQILNPEPLRFETTLLVNKPRAEVFAFFNGATTATMSFTKGANPDEFHGTTADLFWSLRLSEDEFGGRTKLNVFVTNQGSPSLAYKVLSTVGAKTIKHAIDMELRNLKALIETGEIATTAGQPTGKRSVLGKSVESAKTAIRSKVESISNSPLRQQPQTTSQQQPMMQRAVGDSL